MGYFRPESSLQPIAAYTTEMRTGRESGDLEIVKRIIKAYQYAACEKEERGDSLWQKVFDDHHIAIHNVFKNGQLEIAMDILRDPVSSNLFIAFDLPSAFHDHLYKTSPYHVHEAVSHTLDSLVCLAEAIGAARLYNPESVPQNSQIIADTIIGQIENKLGRTLSFPNLFLGELGILTCRGIASYRAPQAIYHAWKIKQLLKDIPHPRILEIGAGLGRTAYYACQLFDIKDYTIVDLAFTELASSYFLLHTLGENQVLLPGEGFPKIHHRVKIITPDEFLESLESYDLILNVDSLTEMDPKTALRYWKKIEVSAPIFISVNHELNPFTVRELIDSSDCVLSNIRTPFWMRQGYVEEIVRFDPTKIKP